jgi:uncharacterized protein
VRAASSILLFVLTACTVSPTTPADANTRQQRNADAAARAVEGQTAIADLYVVDCLLPGQVRQLGNRTFLSPRRPIRTTASDCRLRGGEYVAYDRADYRSALRVWMPAAEGGDAEAQTNVGEIFERGLGDTPNYEAAALWYRRAAEQGHKRAQFNLGTLYEQGLGVPADQLEALNWYRRAWGIEADDILFASAAERERDALRAQLEEQLGELEAQIELLTRQLRELEQRARAREGDSERETRTLRTLIAQLEAQQVQSRERIASLPPRTREPTPGPSVAPPDSEAMVRTLSGHELGRYYALLIGNQSYEMLEDLESPLNDIALARQILEEKYGFTVFVVADGDNVSVMQAINDLNEVVGDNDNLLLFYAGHGSRLTTGQTETGYWLPFNAEQPPRNTYWVPNEFVTGHLARLRAKRVLVVADSCYAGLLSSEPSFLLLSGDAQQFSRPELVRMKIDKRSRLLLTSGGDRPVLDGGGGQHSVFARAFLHALEENDGVMAGPQLFLRIRDQVQEAAAQLDFEQRPEFKTIKAAGHEVGDFFFVPLSLVN